MPVAAFLLLALAANLPSLSGLVHVDPALYFSGLAQNVQPGWLAEPPGWIDPAVGLYTQPLGQLAMHDWVHGVVPWWNPYSGLGMPLAAETNGPAFFFPFNLVMLSAQGWLWMRVLMQAACGVLGYALGLELGLARLAAFLGGGLYALSPAFLLSPHSAIAPMPFLPMLLLGVERAAKAKRGWGIIAAAMAWSITAGFPEVALFNGMLTALWSITRAAALRGRMLAEYFGQQALGVALGTALTAPLLVPFLDYVSQANLGAHGTSLLANAVVEPGTMALQIVPFAFGLFGGSPPAGARSYMANGWVRLPGWIDLQVLIFSLAALVRPNKATSLRLALAGWVLFWELRYAGFPPLVWLVNAMPVVNQTDFTRFTGPSLNFALFLLATLGFNDYLRGPPLSARRLIGVWFCLTALVCALVAPAWRFFAAWYIAMPDALRLGAICVGFGALVLLFASRELLRRRHPRMLCGVLLAGMLVELTATQLGGLRGGTLDMKPVRFLQAHIGLSRMVSLGPLDSNFNLTYHIPSLTYSSLPVPALMAHEVYYHLVVFNPVDFSLNDPSLVTNIHYALPRMAADGVRYIVAPAGLDWRKIQDFTPLPADTALHPVQLGPGKGAKAFHFTLSYKAPRQIAGISLALSTPPGPPVSISAQICIDTSCGTATASAPGGLQQSYVDLTLKQPLVIGIGYRLIALRFSQEAGAPVTFWAGTDWLGQQEPQMRLLADRPADPTREVFNDGTVAIYQLASTAPYASANLKDCNLSIENRQDFTTDCPAPARLLRRELYYPGWRAGINGVEQKITAGSGLFQSVALPAGPARIHFYYRPRHTPLSVAIALAALGLWLGLWARPWRLQRR